ncbi:Tannase/feruloyl esterase [Limtongia smithiae]|uniref:Tannase/feruloyl esterase n=1 Tax=Limtongia smithiae TaxID=1125753 RepID=UPI0034CD6209
MRSTIWISTTALLATVTTAAATYLSDICTDAYASAALPFDVFPYITIDASSVSTEIVWNYSASSVFYPTSTFNYCNLTFSYSHNGIDGDVVNVEYWLPAPSNFQNRYVSTGGGGWAINSGASMLPTAIIVGGVGGLTDGGFGSFTDQFTNVALLANGTVNWHETYMFGFQAHHELAELGKALTRNIYGVASDTKIYSYYQGCSEGGREGWSQVQRFPEQFDGIAVGAPAFRWAQQQVNHLTGNVIEQTKNYYPPTCELEKIMNLTIAACDPLDGKTDGIVSRSDLCRSHVNYKGFIGTPYSCAASSSVPEQTGNITAEAIDLIFTYWNGLHDSDGNLVYFSYQPGSSFDDLQTAYDSSTGEWGLSIDGLGGMWVAYFIDFLQMSDLTSLTNVTYDTLKEWMIFSQARYGDILQTTYPDLTAYQAAGGKVIHFHGEQDFSIPTASSVRYWDSVRSIMYPGKSYTQGAAELDDFYRLYLVPGAGHCALNDYEPDGPWPQTSLQTVIDWVENGNAPDTLAGTGEIDTLCRWPFRPLWTNNGTDFNCVYDQFSIDSFSYDLTAYKMPVY